MPETPDKEITEKPLEAKGNESSSDGPLSDGSSQKSAFEQAAQQQAPNVIVEFTDFLLPVSYTHLTLPTIYSV